MSRSTRSRLGRRLAASHRAGRGPLRRGRELAAFAVLAGLSLIVAGCLEKPEIEDRWTRVDILSANVTPGQALAAGTAESLSVRTHITYRRIITGFAVAELRASSAIAPGAVSLHPEAPRVPMANDVDLILQNSVSLGRQVRAVTGWDHLIQPIQFDFRAVPQMTVDSAGVALGATNGLFLVCYLGSGERIERRGMADSIAITPFPSGNYELLPVGMELSVAP